MAWLRTTAPQLTVLRPDKRLPAAGHLQQGASLAAAIASSPTAAITAGIAPGIRSRVGQLLQVGQGQPAANDDVVQQQLPHLAGTGGQRLPQLTGQQGGCEGSGGGRKHCRGAMGRHRELVSNAGCGS